VTVVVATLHAGEPFAECLSSLESQTFRDFETIVVDNSGKHLVAEGGFAKVIANDANVGFGAAINQAFRASNSRYLATLNDDAVAHPGWLQALVAVMESYYEIGMCASRILLAGEGRLDSAGMLLCPDGSSKQRGHGESPERYSRLEETLLPSGCAAIYRRDMLDEIGLFDESFFLYCEDTDLGLRARWAAWECRYVPDAMVDHRYSHSAGKASALKAYHVERNRLFLCVKNFPASALLRVPFYEFARYAWHALYAWRGRGAAARFREDGNSSKHLFAYVLRAHFDVLRNWRSLRKRARTAKRRLTPEQFRRMMRRFAIGPRQVAAL